MNGIEFQLALQKRCGTFNVGIDVFPGDIIMVRTGRVMHSDEDPVVVAFIPWEHSGLTGLIQNGNSWDVPDWENVKIYWNPDGIWRGASTICEYTKADAVKEYGGTEEEAWKKALICKRKIDADYGNFISLPASGWISPDDGWVVVGGQGGIGCALLINGVAVGMTAPGSGYGMGQPGLFPISKNDKLNIAVADGTIAVDGSNDSCLSMLRFFPNKKQLSDLNTVENNSVNGIYYRKHSDGFLEMWGKISDGTVGDKNINFPINFIDDNYSVNTSISNGVNQAGSFVYVNETTVSGMTIYVSANSTIRWKAEGYWK